MGARFIAWGCSMDMHGVLDILHGVLSGLHGDARWICMVCSMDCMGMLSGLHGVLSGLHGDARWIYMRVLDGVVTNTLDCLLRGQGHCIYGASIYLCVQRVLLF